MFYIIILFLIPVKNVYARKQGKLHIDSLRTELKTAKQDDTLYVNILNTISSEIRINEPDTAIHLAKMGLVVAEKIKFTNGIANAYYNIGSGYFRHDNYSEALKNYFAALKIRTASGNKARCADIYLDIGIVDFYKADYPDALKNYQASLKLREDVGDKRGAANAYFNIGIVYETQGNYSEALNNYHAALKSETEANNKNGIAGSYRRIGAVYADQGYYPEALKYYFAALKIQEETGDKPAIAISYGDIGRIYDDQNNYPEALKHFLAALTIQKQQGDKQGIVNSYNDIGLLYSAQNNYPEALNNFNQSLKICGEIGNRYFIVNLYSNIGNLYLHQRDYANSLKNYFLSLQIAKEIEYKQGITMVYNNIGAVYEMQGDFKEALKNFLSAYKIKEKTGTTEGIITSYNNLGRIYTELRKYNEARKYLYAGLLLAKKARNVDDIRNAYRALTVLDSTTGNWKGAYLNNKLLVVYTDSIFNKENTKKLVQIQMQYDFDKKEALQKLQQAKKDALAAEILNKKRTISYASLIISMLLLIITGISVYSYNNRRKLSFQKKVAETEMMALRAQMNPHFIFNALNSINTYIRDNNNNMASSYLLKFSTLIRIVLENSMHQSIPLTEELHALELYLSLEKLRLDQKLDYEIEVARDIDKDNTLIPPLILQPFIENAILHGLQHKKDGGKIKIQIVKLGSMMHCLITDNGIGLREASKMKLGTYAGKKQSLGMKLTEQRISTINQTKKTNAYIAVTDVDDKGLPTGVKAELVLPLDLRF